MSTELVLLPLGSFSPQASLTGVEVLLLVGIFFVTSGMSVATGGTSLITVPVLIQMGMSPQRAIANNMFALTLMSLGATLSFVGKDAIDRQRLPFLIILTVVGSGGVPCWWGSCHLEHYRP